MTGCGVKRCDGPVLVVRYRALHGDLLDHAVAVNGFITLIQPIGELISQTNPKASLSSTQCVLTC
jgi:hypothetical protein